MKKVTKKKVHRHKWTLQYDECNFCGGGSYEECECGEVRDPDTKKEINIW